ncbi:MAG TPA: DUF6398 domain-containing protein [Candidatus Dormibacteraeota bacterium]|nr:DUF6398 domain-containing protein [Candidatus Dormibacteraeota bacterium]
MTHFRGMSANCADSPAAWWVLRRDVSPSVRARGQPVVFATLVLDSTRAVAGAHTARDAGESLRFALWRAAERSRSERPAAVRCEPGLGGEVGEELTRLALRAPVCEEPPPDAVVDVFEAVVGRMAGRRQAADPPTPDEWRSLHGQALSYLRRRPWERLPAGVDIPLGVRLDGTIAQVRVLLLAEGDGRRGVGISPVPDPAATGPGPRRTLLALETDGVPHELAARSERYGWPPGLLPRPVFVAFDHEGACELDARDARAVTAALGALLELDAPAASATSAAGDRPAVQGRGLGRGPARGSRGAAENPAGSLGPMHPTSGVTSCGAQSRPGGRSFRSSSAPPDLGHLEPKSLGQVSGRTSSAPSPMEGALADLRIPRRLRQDAAEILRLTDSFCAEHLDAEYGHTCRRLVARLARRRPTPLARGDPRVWAAAAIYTVGSLDFLFHPSSEPHINVRQLSALTGVPRSTLAARARQIRDLLGLRPMDPRLRRRQLLSEHPYAWPLDPDGTAVPQARPWAARGDAVGG